jgi:hypothetical protein
VVLDFLAARRAGRARESGAGRGGSGERARKVEAAKGRAIHGGESRKDGSEGARWGEQLSGDFLAGLVIPFRDGEIPWRTRSGVLQEAPHLRTLLPSPCDAWSDTL